MLVVLLGPRHAEVQYSTEGDHRRTTEIFPLTVCLPLPIVRQSSPQLNAYGTESLPADIRKGSA